MTCRIYLDEYYLQETSKPGKRNTDLRILQQTLVDYLTEHFDGEWFFGKTIYVNSVKRCIYFHRDEVATLFVLKFGAPFRVVYER